MWPDGYKMLDSRDFSVVFSSENKVSYSFMSEEEELLDLLVLISENPLVVNYFDKITSEQMAVIFSKGLVQSEIRFNQQFFFITEAGKSEIARLKSYQLSWYV